MFMMSPARQALYLLSSAMQTTRTRTWKRFGTVVQTSRSIMTSNLTVALVSYGSTLYLLDHFDSLKDSRLAQPLKDFANSLVPKSQTPVVPSPYICERIKADNKARIDHFIRLQST